MLTSSFHDCTFTINYYLLHYLLDIRVGGLLCLFSYIGHTRHLFLQTPPASGYLHSVKGPIIYLGFILYPL